MKARAMLGSKGFLVCALAGLVLVSASGCPSDAATPANSAGSGGAAAGGGAAGQAAPAATFSAVYAMMFPMDTNARCNACHANPANDVGNGKLQMGMDKATAYKALVGVASASSRCMNKSLVAPGQPDSSLFYLKLTATPPCGVRMPNGGNAFTSDQLEMVRSWIAAGARDD
jgi:hypothetical protein